MSRGGTCWVCHLSNARYFICIHRFGSSSEFESAEDVVSVSDSSVSDELTERGASPDPSRFNGLSWSPTCFIVSSLNPKYFHTRFLMLHSIFGEDSLFHAREAELYRTTAALPLGD